MQHLDLCSGIGGFALAARWMGWETIAFCERDKFCQKVLKKHWPEVNIYDDLTTFNASEFMGRVDILTAGYPCQPFSQAGKRMGAEDDRHLWPEVRRVITECRPRWIVCENVAGHVTMGLDDVLTDLESEGYAAQAVVIPACASNAPHARSRVWIIANDTSERTYGRELSVQPRRSFQANAYAFGRTQAVADLTNADSFGRERFIGEAFSRRYGITRELAGSFATFNDGWTVSAPLICRVDDGISARVDRTRALGNAIVPQVAHEIFKAIELADEVKEVE